MQPPDYQFESPEDRKFHDSVHKKFLNAKLDKTDQPEWYRQVQPYRSKKKHRNL
jgi:hypothetical protein